MKILVTGATGKVGMGSLAAAVRGVDAVVHCAAFFRGARRLVAGA